MKRRIFIKLVVAAALFPWAVGGWLFRRIAPAGVVRAWRTKTYPGRVVPLVMSDVAKPGRWNG